jgi:MerR family transcriptional regulator, light-induced transcriptional regulator
MHERPGNLRIGELSRRVGVSTDLLRAWERRYGLLRPARSPGDFRLYSEGDEARVRAMQRHLALGLSAAEAARAAQSEPPDGSSPHAALALRERSSQLLDALLRYDEAEAHARFDDLLAAFATDTVLTAVVLPVLRAMGERWSAGEITIAQEHFASSVLRGRLLGLARGWGRGSGPAAVLASPPGELHDLPLVLFGIALREAGWRIMFLGADTPIATIAEAVRSVAARAVVLNAVLGERLAAVEGQLAELARSVPVAIGGAGAERELAERLGAVLLEDDPVAAATRFAERPPPLV